MLHDTFVYAFLIAIQLNVSATSYSQCSYTAKQSKHLKCHVESAHLGIDYSCGLCDFKTKWKNRLKTHKKSINKEGVFPCSFCG
jgi:hypothetical protein